MTDEERKARIHHHMYETCEGIAEHAERIVALEELCADMWKDIVALCGWRYANVKYLDRVNELGVPR